MFGAAYTDVHLRLSLLIVLPAAALLGAALCVFNIWRAGIRLPVLAVAIVFAVSIVERSYRSVSKLSGETGRVKAGVATSPTTSNLPNGFALDHITSAPFPTKGRLTPEVIAADRCHHPEYPLVESSPVTDTSANYRNSVCTTASMTSMLMT